MATFIQRIEQDIETGAEDFLKGLRVAAPLLPLIPVSDHTRASIAALLGAFTTAATDTALAASEPLNIVVDIETANAISAAIKAGLVDLSALHIKL